MNYPIIFLDWHNQNKISASFFFLLLRLLMKKCFFYSVTDWTVVISLYVNKTKRKCLRRIQKWAKTPYQINQEIRKASKNNCNSSKAFQLAYPCLVRICWEHSTCCFIYRFGIQVISEKTLRSKDFASNLRDIFAWQ